MKRIEMKVNHIHKDSDNYIRDYLLTLGIKEENINHFIRTPSIEDEDNPCNLDNLEDAVKIAKDMLDKPDTKVFVQVDSDTDGYTSSAVLINYIKRRFPNISISYALHPGKEHGIVPAVIGDDINLVFIPDAGSNNYDEQKELIDKGKTVIILDHHEVHDYINTGAILVNNQFSPRFSNKSMSGVGIVYMFIKRMDQLYFDLPIYEEYRDLTAIGIIADAMNMTTLGNNYLSYFGLSHIKSQFIKELAIKQSRGIKNPDHLTKMDVAFYIAPVINGVIRSGSPEDKQLVFKALTTENCEDIFTSEWRGKVRNETLYEYAVRTAANAKSRQDSAKKKSFEWLCTKIRDKGWDKYNIVIATLDEKESMKVSPNITGLIAMELVKEFNKPCLVLRETDFEGAHVYGGSGRNGNFYGLPSLLDFLRDSGHVRYAEGHANAFGVFIDPEEVQKVRDYSLEKLNPQIFDDKVFEVDYWFHTGEEIDKGMLFDFAACGDIWGNGLPRPTFAFDFNYDASELQVMGKDASSLKIKHDGVDFVLFKNPEVINKMTSIPMGHVQIVGAANLNEWMGRQSVQIMIEDIEVKDFENLPKRSVLDLI